MPAGYRSRISLSTGGWHRGKRRHKDGGSTPHSMGLEERLNGSVQLQAKKDNMDGGNRTSARETQLRLDPSPCRPTTCEGPGEPK